MAVTAGTERSPVPTERPAQTSDQRRLAPVDGRSPEPAAQVRQAGKRFDEWVVRNLDLRVDYGTIFGIFGPSGSGKTTTIRLLLGLLRPDEGELQVLGTTPRKFRASTRARIGYMPQHFVLYPELSVLENLHLVASLYGLGWLRRRRLMREVLDLVELWEHRRKRADELSGGMKRRLELATALVHRPDLIVADEPTAGVDPILRSKFWDHFRGLREQGRTVFVTSQYVTEAEYCDQVAVLGRGQIVASGTPDSLRRQAYGGEIVDVVADGLDRSVVDSLAGLDGVQQVRPLSYEQLQLSVDEASVAIPRVLEVLQQGGIDVKQVQEYRPNFDEVFVRLVEQSGVERVD